MRPVRDFYARMAGTRSRDEYAQVKWPRPVTDQEDQDDDQEQEAAR